MKSSYRYKLTQAWGGKLTVVLVRTINDEEYAISAESGFMNRQSAEEYAERELQRLIDEDKKNV